MRLIYQLLLSIVHFQQPPPVAVLHQQAERGEGGEGETEDCLGHNVEIRSTAFSAFLLCRFRFPLLHFKN